MKKIIVSFLDKPKIFKGDYSTLYTCIVNKLHLYTLCIDVYFRILIL